MKESRKHGKRADEEFVLDWLNGQSVGLDAHLGVRYVEAGPERVVAEVAVDARHLQPHGLVHGGVYASLVESACSTGANLSVLPEGRVAVGLENSTSFLAAVRTGRLRCEAVPLVRGGRSHVWRAEVRDEAGRLVAEGRVRLLVLPGHARAAGRPLKPPVES